MNVLIIGGTGLISTGIVKALAGDARITVLNRAKTPSRLPPDVRTIIADRNDHTAFSAALSDQRFDAVIDMICFEPRQARQDIDIFAGRTGHFIFCSTVCTYGNTQTNIPTTEAILPRPHSSYGENKLSCEKIFSEAHDTKKVPVTIFRPSHTYGPGGALIHNLGWHGEFISRLRRGQPILVSGDGHGLWQSAFCDDVGVGFARCIGRRCTFGEIYNIVGSEVFTWDQYVQRIASAINAPVPKIVHVSTDTLLSIAPKRYGGLAEIFRYHGVYCNNKINRDIPEYRPATSFDEGIRRTVAWMDSQHVTPDVGPSLEDHVMVAVQNMTASLAERFPETQ